MLFKGRKFSTNKVLLNKRQFIHDDGFAIVNEFDKMRLRADKRNNRLLASIDKKNFDQQVDYQRSRTDLESDIMPDYFDKNRTDADLANDEFANRNQLIANCLKVFKGNEIKANELMQALLSTGLDGFFNKFITRIMRMVYENFGSKPKIQDVIDLVTFLEANQNSPNFWNMAQTGPAGPQGQQGLPGVAGPAGPGGRPPTPQNPRVPTPQGQPPTPPFVPINQPPRVPTPQGPIIQPTPRGPTPPTPRGPTPPTPPAAQPPTPPSGQPSSRQVFKPFQPTIGILGNLDPMSDAELLSINLSGAEIPDPSHVYDIIVLTKSRAVFEHLLHTRYRYPKSLLKNQTNQEIEQLVDQELNVNEIGLHQPPISAMPQPSHQDIAALGANLADQDAQIFEMIDLYINNHKQPLKKHMIEILTIRYGEDKTRISNLLRTELVRRVKQKVHEERVQRNSALFASLSSGNRKRGGTPP